MNKKVPIEELVPIFLEVFKKGGSVNFTPKGNSMLPMLRDNKDSVVLSQYTGKLKKYDLPLFKYKPQNKYILHRVIGKNKEGHYIMCGDNNDFCEYDVKDEDIVAVVISFKRKGKNYSVNNIIYKCYVRFWVGKKFVKWKYRGLKCRLYACYKRVLKK